MKFKVGDKVRWHADVHATEIGVIESTIYGYYNVRWRCFPAEPVVSGYKETELRLINPSPDQIFKEILCSK